MNRAYRGFTLIELMMVVVIIGILAAISLTVYPDYTKRARMSEVVLALSACRTPIAETYKTKTIAPGAGNWGCDVGGPASAYVQSIQSDEDGKVTVLAKGFNDTAIDGKVLTFVPLIGNTPAASATDFGKEITGWRCGSPGDGTTISQNYLPSTCRGI
jgi:type IV pilus assembly protein PilA